ncbi:non-ribosomal peptide synthetase [Paracidovorax anthurii]|uniref:Amino acid adenylation domain-containing protein n=1 Tax=Paracidovorax anthurii TaxID=78229 RepID=A0A328ZI79_9BURK|nr:non-ribosomal peptide synthetase [Paracidovorax anthurii]RAR84272.1 amino acid adenylation domain-containing protein [Paracidovorax anthurii]
MQSISLPDAAPASPSVLPRNFVEHLQALAAQRPDVPWLTVVDEVQGQRREITLTYGEFEQRVRSLAAKLQSRFAVGARALVLLDNDEHYAVSMLACFYSGVIAVPVFPPESQRPQHLARLQGIRRDSGAECVLTASAWTSLCRAAFDGLETIAVDALDEALAQSWRPFDPAAQDIAFLQYTSGSTGNPKGVMVTHGNLMANERCIQAGMGLGAEDRFVSWAPLYHDMGLIGGLLQPLYSGASLVLMSPRYFLERPVRWLEQVSRHRATVSGGPDFAYRLCLERISEAQLAALDLSHWRVAYSGAEPVRADTMADFARHVAPAGFDAGAVYACYGLAEATLYVTGGGRGQGLWARGFSADALAVGAATADGQGPLLVGCGKAAADHAVAVMDVQSLVPVEPGSIGEIWASGPSIAAGYWGREAETAQTFVEHDGRRWLRTGDLGFVLEDQLVVTGRLKDLIILRGHNVYPQDVERAIEAEVEAVRKGRVAVFPVQGVQSEGIGAAVEVSRGMQKLVPPEKLVEVLSAAVSEAVGEPLSVVLLLEPGTLPKTTSGKLQRSACRAAWKDRTPDAYAIYEWGDFVRGGPQRMPSQAADLTPLEQILSDLWRNVLRLDAARPLDPDAHFFVLGGNSLAATQAAARIGQQWGIAFTPRDIFEHPRLRHCAEAVQRAQAQGAGGHAASPSAPPLERLPDALRQGPLALSHAQARQWFLWKMDPNQAAYHVGVALRLSGPLESDALRAALDDVARRHESLRTCFGEGPDGAPFQQISDAPWPALEVIDLEAVPAARRESLLNETLQRLQSEPFDLLRGHPWRVLLVRMDTDRHVLAVVMHHILSDGASLQVWALEWIEAYAARSQGLTVQEGAPAVQVVDYAAWARSRLDAGEGARQLAWWRDLLGERPVACELRTDHPRAARAAYTASRHAFDLPRPLIQKLQALRHRLGATSFMVLLAALHMLLHRYTGQASVRVGAAIAHRGRPECDRLIGLLVNTLVLPANVDGRASLEAVLQQARETVLGAHAHQDLPFDQLVDALRPERSASLSPLFQVMLNHLVDDTRAVQALPGLTVEAEPLQGPQAQFELVLEAREREDGAISLTWVYARELFEPDTIERLAAHYLAVLEALAHAPGQAVGAVELLSHRERERLEAWGRNVLRESAHRPVHQSFEAHAARQPQAVALLFGEQALTYAELNRRANRLAHQLRHQGLHPHAVVGLCMHRSVEMIVAMLAVMKAGAAYLPLDPDYPADRLAYTARHSGLVMLLTHGAASHAVPRQDGLRVVDVDAIANGQEPQEVVGNPDIPVHGDQLAYVIYTSGSTGRPKGVAVRHAALHTCMAWMQSTYGLASTDTVLHKAPFGFDVSCWEIFWPLTAGARLVVAPPGAHRDPEQLVGLIERHQITTLNFVPSMLQAFLDHPGIESRTRLRHIICGGEAMPEALQREALRRLPGATLQNLYGPTETTIHVTRWTCLDRGGPVPIGQPISETEAWVLDTGLNPTPQGVAGELYIGGALLARGYLGQPGLTAERFVAHPHAAGQRLYRTGDWVRWNAEGQLEYFGRIDHQVKLRGLRIELGEIESRLRSEAGVRDAVAVVRGQAGEEVLVAYVAGDADATRLREALVRQLPDYMVPRAITLLEALPLNANGKVDRAALPEPDGIAATRVHRAPEGATAQKLAALWSELLGVEPVGMNDNFFDLGGHSLLLIRAHRMLQERWGWTLPLVDLFQHPTVETLASHIDRQSAHGAQAADTSAAKAADDRALRQRAALLQRRALTQGIQG